MDFDRTVKYRNYKSKKHIRKVNHLRGKIFKCKLTELTQANINNKLSIHLPNLEIPQVLRKHTKYRMGQLVAPG